MAKVVSRPDLLSINVTRAMFFSSFDSDRKQPESCIEMIRKKVVIDEANDVSAIYWILINDNTFV